MKEIPFTLASFSLGCFWEPDIFFSKLPGVIQTRVGYSGGSTKNPTYSHIGDHTESIEITFDPSKISYGTLLEHFWQKHNPSIAQKTQYASIIFTHSEKQYQEAIKSLKEEQKRYHSPILTKIRPAEIFWEAEEYHQKYLEKRGDLLLH